MHIHPNRPSPGQAALRAAACFTLAACSTLGSIADAAAMSDHWAGSLHASTDSTLLASVPTRPEEMLPSDGLLVAPNRTQAWLAVPAGATAIRLNPAEVGHDGSVVTVDPRGQLKEVLVEAWDGSLWHDGQACDAAAPPTVLTVLPRTTTVRFERSTHSATLLDAEQNELGRYNLGPGC